MFREILFPVDFSKRCLCFAPHVRMIASQLQARVTLLHVVELSYMWYAGSDAPLYSTLIDINQFREAGERRLQQIREAEFPGMDVNIVQQEGLPADVIGEYSGRHGIGLIMMPTHGCGTFRRALLGSVTAKVLHDLQVPVWTAVHRESTLAEPPHAPRRVLAAVDKPESSLGVIRCADEIAKKFQAELSVVHAVQDAATVLAHYTSNELMSAKACQDREEIRRAQEAAGISGEIHSLVGDIASTVCQQAERVKADLLVMGRGHLRHPLGRLRTHLYSIIQEAPCPVLSV